MKEFFCPICESKLEFANQSKIWKEPRFICHCRSCGVFRVGVNKVNAYLEFLNAVPVQFYLEKLSDRLDEIGAELNCILCRKVAKRW